MTVQNFFGPSGRGVIYGGQGIWQKKQLFFSRKISGIPVPCVQRAVQKSPPLFAGPGRDRPIKGEGGLFEGGSGVVFLVQAWIEVQLGPPPKVQTEAHLSKRITSNCQQNVDQCNCQKSTPLPFFPLASLQMSSCVTHLRKQFKALTEKPVAGFSVEVFDVN